MKIGFCFSSLAAFVSAIAGFVPNAVLADASLEEQAQVMMKKYGSGNSIELACGPRGSRKCVVTTMMYRKKQRLHIDFDDYGVRPDMQEIRLYVQSLDGSEYSFWVSATCQDEDMALAPEQIAIVDCLVQFRVDDGKIKELPQVQIFPITTQKLYRTIKPLTHKSGSPPISRTLTRRPIRAVSEPPRKPRRPFCVSHAAIGRAVGWASCPPS